MLAAKAIAETRKSRAYPLPGDRLFVQSIAGPSSPAAAVGPTVLKLASPKYRADSSRGTRSASSVQLPLPNAAEPTDIKLPNSRICIGV